MERLLTVRIDDALHQKVKMATVAKGTTVAAVVRSALKAYAAKNAGKAPAKAKAKAKKPVKRAKK